MSIVRVGLSETERYSDGWSAIFGKTANSGQKRAKPGGAKAAKSTAKKTPPKAKPRKK